jgi:hypothetical protein
VFVKRDAMVILTEEHRPRADDPDESEGGGEGYPGA